MNSDVTDSDCRLVLLWSPAVRDSVGELRRSPRPYRRLRPDPIQLLHYLSLITTVHVWDGLDIFHKWITIDFHDKLSHGNPRVSRGGQVDRDRTGKMSSRKISGKWASAGTRLKRLRRTGGAGGIVSPNASLTRDEPGTRKVAIILCCPHSVLRNFFACWTWCRADGSSFR